MSDALSRPFPVVLAPTGMVPTRSMTPHVPLTPHQVAADVRAAAAVGITSVHLHARDSDGAPDWRRETYARLVGAVRDAVPDIVVVVSTSGRNWSELERRADCLALTGDLAPDLASLTLSSLNFVTGPSVNSPDVIRGLARIMADRGIVPELEVFDLGMVNMIHVLRKQGLLPGPVVVNLFLGNIAGAQTTPMALGAMLSALPDDAIWCGAGIGVHQAAAHALSLASGGGVRTGLEDSIHLDATRTRLATNEEQVMRVHDMARTLGRCSMTSEQLRSLLKGAS